MWAPADGVDRAQSAKARPAGFCMLSSCPRRRAGHRPPVRDTASGVFPVCLPVSDRRLGQPAVPHCPQPTAAAVTGTGRPHARAKVLHSREMAPPGQRGRWEPGTFARVSGGLSPWSGHLHHLQTKNRWSEGPLGSAPPPGPEATSWGRPLPAGHHCLASFVNRTVDPLS